MKKPRSYRLRKLAIYDSAFPVGLTELARLMMEELEVAGVIGPAEGTKPRKVFADEFSDSNFTSLRQNCLIKINLPATSRQIFYLPITKERKSMKLDTVHHIAIIGHDYAK